MEKTNVSPVVNIVPEQPKKLMIGMPCYNCSMHIDATKTLIETMGAGVSYNWVSIGNESLISRARNNILSLFYHQKDFTHLLFLDADIYMNGQDVKKLLESGKDVIGAAVRLKAKNTIYNFTFDQPIPNCEPPKEDGERYYKVTKLGTAALMLSRKAVEAVIDNAKKKHENIIKLCLKLKDVMGKDWPKEYEDILNKKDVLSLLNIIDGIGYIYGRSSILMGGDLADNMPKEYYDICKVGVKNELYLSEDYYLCSDLKELGFDIYVDRTIRTRHNGTVEFE
ncbi:MAG: hypothetical protein HGB12_00210 [Bacteroidetes bacterium]|nr:hypothetical protein [Bacteroidota bacterium]